MRASATSVTPDPHRLGDTDTPPERHRLGRVDAVVLAALFVALVAVYATRFRSWVGAGDAPNTVAAVDTLGILHAPGYFAYVAAARLFSELAPIGSLAAQVNAFSVAATLAALAALYVTARRVGASRVAAAIAVAGVGIAASVWTSATYAKHNAFTFALIATAFAAATHPGRRGWIVPGVALGVAAGAGVHPAAIAALGVIIITARRDDQTWGWRRPLAVAAVATTIGMGVLAATAIRAGGDPEITFGDWTSAAGVIDTLTLADFGFGRDTDAIDSQTASGIDAGDLVALPMRIGEYGIVLWRDLGPVLAALTAVGFWVATGATRHEPRAFGAVIVLNVTLLAVAVTVSADQGFAGGNAQASFLLPTIAASGVLAAIGVDRVRAAAPATAATPALAALAAAVLVPSLLTHARPADHSPVPVVDRYATAVLDELPPDAVIVTDTVAHAWPMQYRQTVHGERRDVTIVSADGLSRSWYRDRLADTLGLPIPDSVGPDTDTLADGALDLFTLLAITGRPVHLDFTALARYPDRALYTPTGLTYRVDFAPQPAPTPGALGELVDRHEHLARVFSADDADRWNRWPTTNLATIIHGSAYAAADYAHAHGDTAAAIDLIDVALRYDPDNPTYLNGRSAIDTQP